MRKKNTKNFVSHEIQVNLRKKIIVCNSVLPDQKNIFFYLVSRYGQWDGSPVQTRNRNPRPGQNSGSQQQFFKHSRKKKKKNSQGEMYQKKKQEIKYSSKEILIRLYFISSISSASLRVSVLFLIASFSQREFIRNYILSYLLIG